MLKNVAGQKITIYAFDTNNSVPKTGDAANITAYISKDSTTPAQTNDINPTELDATNMKGLYVFDLTQIETDADVISLDAVSSTGNISIEPVIIHTANVNVVQISDDAGAADNLEAQYDGTGIVGDTFPSTQSQLGAPEGANISADIKRYYENLFDLTESQRGSHTGFNIYHLGPANGNDANDGLTRATSKKTWPGVFALCSDRGHDIVKIHSDNTTGQTVLAEPINTTGKAFTFVRGDGGDLLIKPTITNAPSVLLGAPGCEFSGAFVETANSGNQSAVKITADFCDAHHFFVNYSRKNGLEIAGCNNSKGRDFLIQKAAVSGAGHAVVIDGSLITTERNLIYNAKMIENLGDGIRIKGEFAKHNFIYGNGEGTIIHNNTGWGINEIENADDTILIGPSIHIGHNNDGDINLAGTNSIAENWQQWATDEDMQTALTNIAAIPIKPVVVLASASAGEVAYGEEGFTVILVQGDTVAIPISISGDYSAKRLFFGAKDDVGDPIYIMGDSAGGAGEIEITGHSYDSGTGKTTGLINLTETQTTVSTAILKAEVEARDPDGLSNPVTPLKFELEVAGEVITVS